MKPLLKAAVLLTCCLGLTAASCTPKPVLTNIRPPDSRLQCVAAGERPKIPAEHTIDWTTVGTAQTVPEAVSRAKAEVAKLVASIRTREGVVAGYLLTVEGKLFACSSNMEWLWDWYAKTNG